MAGGAEGGERGAVILGKLTRWGGESSNGLDHEHYGGGVKPAPFASRRGEGE
jgi:hypothetical protein